jgi:hypothetical protein
MTSHEYVAAGRNEYIAAGKEVDELLHIADRMPGVTIKKVASRYVVFEADEDDAAQLSEQLAGKYQIAPNRELGIIE